MRAVAALVAATVLAGTGLAADRPWSPPGSVRILLAGDSITQGSSGDRTWRRHLWRALARGGVRADLVGPRDDLWDNRRSSFAVLVDGEHTYASADFDLDHDARAGRTLREATGTIADRVAEYRPDYLVVALGVNDLALGGTPAAIAADLRTFLTRARAARPGLRVVVLTVPPVSLVGPAMTAEYNRLAALVVRERRGVVVADLGAGWDASPWYCGDTWDGVHPSARGELRIASAVAGALRTAYGLPVARVPDAVPGPRVEAAPEVRREGGTLTLEWEDVPGSTRYAVEFRVSGTPWSTAATRRLPATPGHPYRLTGLDPGLSYDVRVRPQKGTCPGRPSPATTVPSSGTA